MIKRQPIGHLVIRVLFDHSSESGEFSLGAPSLLVDGSASIVVGLGVVAACALVLAVLIAKIVLVSATDKSRFVCPWASTSIAIGNTSVLVLAAPVIGTGSIVVAALIALVVASIATAIAVSTEAAATTVAATATISSLVGIGVVASVTVALPLSVGVYIK